MKARKAMALAMTAAMVGGLMTVPVMAEENAELLPGGGSNIIYCITPSTSNPFFNTEQVIAKEKTEQKQILIIFQGGRIYESKKSNGISNDSSDGWRFNDSSGNG